ncbi:hypothetical protein TUN199_12311, partial [Pyrenophora tritici-repentis]
MMFLGTKLTRSRRLKVFRKPQIRTGPTRPVRPTRPPRMRLKQRRKPRKCSSSFSLSSISLFPSAWGFPYQARRHSHASIISAFSLPRRSTI